MTTPKEQSQQEKCICGKPLDHEIIERLDAGFTTHYAVPEKHEHAYDIQTFLDGRVVYGCECGANPEKHEHPKCNKCGEEFGNHPADVLGHDFSGRVFDQPMPHPPIGESWEKEIEKAIYKEFGSAPTRLVESISRLLSEQKEEIANALKRIVMKYGKFDDGITEEVDTFRKALDK